VSATVFPAPQAMVPGQFEGALVERSVARVHGVSHREHSEQPQQQFDADSQHVAPGVAMGAVPVVQRPGLDLLLRRGGVSGGSGLGRDDLSRISSSILHAILPNGRLRAAQLADLRARALQHGTTDPADVLGYAHVRGVRSIEKHPGANHLAQLVERVCVCRAHRQPGGDGELGDDALRVGHLGRIA